MPDDHEHPASSALAMRVDTGLVGGRTLDQLGAEDALLLGAHVVNSPAGEVIGIFATCATGVVLLSITHTWLMPSIALTAMVVGLRAIAKRRVREFLVVNLGLAPTEAPALVAVITSIRPRMVPSNESAALRAFGERLIDEARRRPQLTAYSKR